MQSHRSKASARGRGGREGGGTKVLYAKGCGITDSATAGIADAVALARQAGGPGGGGDRAGGGARGGGGGGRGGARRCCTPRDAASPTARRRALPTPSR